MISPELSSVTRKKVFLLKKDLLPYKDGRIYNKIISRSYFSFTFEQRGSKCFRATLPNVFDDRLFETNEEVFLRRLKKQLKSNFRG